MVVPARLQTHKQLPAPRHGRRIVNTPSTTTAVLVALIVGCGLGGVITSYWCQRGSFSSHAHKEILFDDDAATTNATKDVLLPFNHNNVATQTRHLIVVAGHSVTVQSHLQRGIALAATDPEALLVISGGQTRARNGPDSEAARYFRLSDRLQLWTTFSSVPQMPTTAAATTSRLEHRHDGGMEEVDTSTGQAFSHTSTTVRARTALEEYATDSFQNILFSMSRFYEITKSYPRRLTIVSYSFKEWRFAQLHMAALHWPLEQFHFVSADDNGTSSPKQSAQNRRAELEIAVPHFQADPYGCQSKVRTTKNPFFRTPPYELSCPGLKDLLRYCGLEHIDRDKVPW